MDSKFADRWFDDEFNPDKTIKEIDDTLKSFPSEEEINLTRKRMADYYNKND